LVPKFEPWLSDGKYNTQPPELGALVPDWQLLNSSATYKGIFLVERKCITGLS